MIDEESRYHGIESATLETGDGSHVAYLKRRLLPPPDAVPAVSVTTVEPGERPDTLSARTIEDPRQFWRLCDANGVMNPFRLTSSPGRSVRIPAGEAHLEFHGALHLGTLELELEKEA